jgi:hypothetical protein
MSVVAYPEVSAVPGAIAAVTVAVFSPPAAMAARPACRSKTD